MDTATVVAALITSIPATIASCAAWRKSKKTKKSLGDSNGRGPLIQMTSDLQDEIRLIAARQERDSLHLQDVLRWQIDHMRSHRRGA